jgi:hypothetical protein
MNNSISDRMRSILARLDRISNTNACLTAIPSPSPLIGLNIVHLYMALYPDENKYYVYVLNRRDNHTRLPYITLPTDLIEWNDIPAATGIENKEWIPMDKCDQYYRYDSYAALHILPDFNTPPPIADRGGTWEHMSLLTALATEGSSNIGRIISRCLREYIIPYLQAKHAHLLS